ncbi:hypothetical protein GC176_01355 [bacterium]|nr:hypothetical protein [bacterium]
MNRLRTAWHSVSFITAIVIAALSSTAPLASAQDAAKDATTAEAPKIPEIADEPRTVDPATILPGPVVKLATVEFKETSLREVADWIQTESGIAVFIDSTALEGAGLLPSEPITDHLQDEPIYFLLDRLRLLDLSWFVQDNVIRITTNDVAFDPNEFQTTPYNVSDFLDAGLQSDRLIATVKLVSNVHWEEVDGPGGNVEPLGDVLFVRQTRAGHRQIKGLLTALRKHGRQTFAYEPPQHQTLRGKLEEPISVSIRDTPLKLAIADLAEQTKTDIRLDTTELKSVGVRDREQVSLVLNNRPLRTVLELLLSKHDLTWSIREGVIWITSRDGAESHLKCAVYDVRDLCRDTGESQELANAIFNQTSSNWAMTGGSGGEIQFPQPGTMVVLQTEPGHEQVLKLLSTYREALLISKNRKRSDPGDEVIDHYYQMQQPIADVLAKVLVTLVAPESWRSEARPDAIGTILLLPSNTGLTTGYAGKANQPATTAGLIVPQSVLIIRQTRKNHEEISTLIGRIQNGDPPISFGGAGGGMGGMGGGFGGGYFSVKPSVGASAGR